MIHDQVIHDQLIKCYPSAAAADEASPLIKFFLSLKPMNSCNLVLPILKGFKPPDLTAIKVGTYWTVSERNEASSCNCKDHSNPHQQEGYRAGAFRFSRHVSAIVTFRFPLQSGHSIPAGSTIESPIMQHGHFTQGTMNVSAKSRQVTSTPPTRKVIPNPEGIAAV